MHERGQESAPFELMVAIVLMTFVLLVGAYAIDKANRDRCFQNNGKVLEELKSALELVAPGKGTSKVNILLEECGEGNPKLLLETESDSQICSNYCTSSTNTCVLLRLENPDITKCVKIAPTTNYPTGGGICVQEQGEELVNLLTDEGIPQGSYTLINAYSSTTSAPFVCAYLHID